MSKPKLGDLKVWWIPQVPMQAFEVPVANIIEARLLLDALANYDLFQLANNIKGDYSNAGGLVIWDGAEWIDWYDTEGDDFDTYELDTLRERAAVNDLPESETLFDHKGNRR